MAVLYERLVTAHPGAPVFYLSTGAWNVAPALGGSSPGTCTRRARCCSPTGGRPPTAGSAAGRSTSAAPWPGWPGSSRTIRWLLVGDDGQHDQEIYAEFAASHPDRVAAVAIRQLSPTQAVLAGGMPAPAVDGARHGTGPRHPVAQSAPDGAGLWQLMRQAGLL